MVNCHIFLVQCGEYIRNTHLIAAVYFVDDHTFDVLQLLLHYTDCVPLHADQLLDKVLVNMLRILTVFKLRDNLLIITSFFHWLIDQVQHHIFEKSIELIVKSIHCDIAQNFISYLAINHEILGL